MSYELLNIQIPAAPKIGRPPKYPWAAMLVGQSFLLPGDTWKEIDSLREYVAVMGRKHQRTYRANLLNDGRYQVARVG